MNRQNYLNLSSTKCDIWTENVFDTLRNIASFMQQTLVPMKVQESHPFSRSHLENE